MGRHKGDGRRPGEVYVWTPDRISRLIGYASRGFSMAETAILLNVSRWSIAQAASRQGIRFHSSRGGAPHHNRNAAGPHHVRPLD